MINHKDKVLVEECIAAPALISVDHINVLFKNNFGHFIETYLQISDDKKVIKNIYGCLVNITILKMMLKTVNVNFCLYCFHNTHG